MYIGCTKKLIEYAKIAPIVSLGTEPFFSWSANMIIINHRRAIVVINDAVRYGFMLYGITAKTIKNLNSLISEGIRSCLEAECVSEEIINQYMRDCGNITYGKTTNRSNVARMNKLCERTYYFAADLNSDFILQRHLIGRINNDVFDINGQYSSPSDLLYGELEKHYSTQNIRSCRAAILDVRLDIETVCSRRIAIPINRTFSQLHRALQCLFNWQDYHLHQFILDVYPDGRTRNVLVGAPPEYEGEDEDWRIDSAVLLSDVFPEKNEIIYNYDFGDDWYHYIKLIDIQSDYDKNYPICLSAVGDAPPEDVGGTYGYAEFLRILDEPNDPEYEDTKTWAEGMKYRSLDIVEINRRLRYSAY